MLSFDLSAIDVVLVIAVITLFILYLKKFSVSIPDEKHFRKQAAQELSRKEKQVNLAANSAKCPRGYGDIKKMNENNSISDRCLACYNIMECYSARIDEL